MFNNLCFYGIRNGFNFWYILIVAIMFAPSIFIFYNSSAWVYVVGYAVIALLGNLIALPLRKDNFQLCAQLRVCSQAGGNPVYPRFSQPDNSESWDDVGNGI